MADYRAQCRHVPEDPGIRAIALRLRKDVLRAGRLLESLAAFYRGWEKILATMSGGYTANGDPAPLARIGKLDCRG